MHADCSLGVDTNSACIKMPLCYKPHAHCETFYKWWKCLNIIQIVLIIKNTGNYYKHVMITRHYHTPKRNLINAWNVIGFEALILTLHVFQSTPNSLHCIPTDAGAFLLLKIQMRKSSSIPVNCQKWRQNHTILIATTLET